MSSFRGFQELTVNKRSTFPNVYFRECQGYVARARNNDVRCDVTRHRDQSVIGSVNVAQR